MSVIGYIKRCTQCDIQMLVTVDYKHGDWCTQCIDEAISDTIDTIPHQVLRYWPADLAGELLRQWKAGR